MDASRAATGMFEVFATSVVRFMIPSVFPLMVVSSVGNSYKTSAISLPRSPTIRPGKKINKHEREREGGNVRWWRWGGGGKKKPQPTETKTSEVETLRGD